MARRNPTPPVELVRQFATEVRRKFASHAEGQPEDQLRNPVERLVVAVGEQRGLEVAAVGEARAEVRGRPDFAIAVARLTIGFIELKAPGFGADVRRLRGRNRLQADQFLRLPNVIYTDGHQWAWYVDGRLTNELVALPGRPDEQGAGAVDSDSARRVVDLLERFLFWTPVAPATTEELARKLAPLCRSLRNDVAIAVNRPGSAMRDLLADLRRALFPDIDTERFADVYAETVTFALLLAKADGADPRDLRASADRLRGGHTLLGRVLELLTDQQAQDEVRTSLSLVQRYLHVVSPDRLREHRQERLIEEVQLEAQRPWIYFYEDFLAEYDPEMRRNAGVYYTPVEVVQCQCRLISELLRERLDRPLGFADPTVITLDPATGTGTYLLGVIDEAAAAISHTEGTGQLAPRLSRLAQNLYGFEWLVGPYAVAELRIAAALQTFDARVPVGEGDCEGGVLLTNTLESPNAEIPNLGRLYRELTTEQQRAQRVKRLVPILVCVGNPPYDRHDAAQQADDYDTTGAWVRWGERAEFDSAEQQSTGILRDWIAAASTAGAGIHLKNLYNLYVYFWRWAIWKVFEQDRDGEQPEASPGIVSYITASSFLRGDAFVGMREAMRRACDDIWIIDLGGEGRGTRREDNVFAIQTPVCITIAFRRSQRHGDRPAAVRYHRIRGTRGEKLAALQQIARTRDVRWKACPTGWHSPFAPSGTGPFFQWPDLTNLMPWRQSGAEIKRSWPIAATAECLERRWRQLLRQRSRSGLMVETRDRTVSSMVTDLDGTELEPLAGLAGSSPMLRVEEYSYRALDRMLLLSDPRVCDYLRPSLWRARSPEQIFLTTLINHPIGSGPAIVAAAHPPDRHHFRGSFGGKDVLPLFRDGRATQANIAPGVLEALGTRLARPIGATDLVAYIYAVLAHPAYADRFWDELESCQVHVPITADRLLFEEAIATGRELLWLHTYGHRLVPRTSQPGQVPTGHARCVRAIPDDAASYPDEYVWDADQQQLFVGPPENARGGGILQPVSRAVWEFEISGLRVVESWLGYRMARRRGRTSSDLDQIHPQRWSPELTRQLLELLWVAERTISTYPRQATLLEQIVAGRLVLAADMPQPLPLDHPLRRSPAGRRQADHGLFGGEDDTQE